MTTLSPGDNSLTYSDNSITWWPFLAWWQLPHRDNSVARWQVSHPVASRSPGANSLTWWKLSHPVTALSPIVTTLLSGDHYLPGDSSLSWWQLYRLVTQENKKLLKASVAVWSSTSDSRFEFFQEHVKVLPMESESKSEWATEPCASESETRSTRSYSTKGMTGLISWT